MVKLPDIVPVTDLRQDAAAVLRKVRGSRGPLVITQRGRAAAVLLSLEEYERSEHERSILTALAQGDKEMLKFMDNNPAMASYPVSYSNHPSLIAKNDRMISINSLIQVDLTGQCNAEYLAGVQVSGTGGQLDFVRGAYDSRGGKSILAFRSTARGGAVSRVVPRLELGAAVTTPRMDTHFLVTEFGAANLKGKSTRQRAKAIIGLAHPEFREELERQAKKMHLA